MNNNSEVNKQRFQLFAQTVLNGHNPAAADQFISANYHDFDTPPGFPQGLEGFKRGFAYLLAAFPDYRSEVQEIVAEGNKLVYLETWHGTHQEEFMGIPPTNRPVSLQVMALLLMEDGKIVTRRAVADRLSLFSQLGMAGPNTQQEQSV